MILGIKKEHHPQKRGFAKSFALLPGCANQYGESLNLVIEKMRTPPTDQIGRVVSPAWEPPYKDPVNEPLRFFETATRALHIEDEQWVDDLPEDWYS
jgi:hypothetical protein